MRLCGAGAEALGAAAAAAGGPLENNDSLPPLSLSLAPPSVTLHS
jgi:hypothetical protein